MRIHCTQGRSKRSLPTIDWDWECRGQGGERTLVPVLGIIPAGQPVESFPFHRTVSIPKDMVGRFETYALRVEGCSMIEENIHDGDYVIIEARETAENGQSVVAIINDQEMTLKRLYIERDHIRLEPANPSLGPIILRNDEVRVLGVVCAVIKKYRYH